MAVLCLAASSNPAEREREVSPTCRGIGENLGRFSGGEFAFFPTTKFCQAPGQLQPSLSVHRRQLDHGQEMIGGVGPASDHAISEAGDKGCQNSMASTDLEKGARSFRLTQDL